MCSPLSTRGKPEGPAALTRALLSVAHEGDVLVVGLGGSWRLRDGLPALADVRSTLDAAAPGGSVRLVADGIAYWDSSLLVTVRRIADACAKRDLHLDTSRLPAAAVRLLEVANAEPSSSAGPRKTGERELVDSLWRLRKGSPLPDVVGATVLEAVDFLGRTAVAVARMLTGRTLKLGLGLTTAMHESGVGTLPILAFIALLGGGVLALLAAQQMDRLGAALLAPNFVAIVILRELGALATGLALAGRLGSANAADLATMVARDEAEALRTMGVSPFDLLVAPRVLALVLMGPLLVMYSIALGLLGSVFVGVGLMDLPPTDYLERTRAALDLTESLGALAKGAAFGFVVGMAGCYHGLRSGKGHAAIGNAVRAAVVWAILGVVLVDAALAVFYKWIRL